MGERTILLVSAIAAFSFTLLSVLSFMKASGNRVFLWLGLLFFAPLLAFISNVLIFFNQGNVWLYHVALLFNLSWGGYLYLIMANLGKKHKKQVNILLFLPSMLYVPFLIYSLFDSELVTEIVSNNPHGPSALITGLYNYLIILYSLGVNLILLVVVFNSTRKLPANALKREILSIMLTLQLFAFVPYLLKMDIIYIIMYMPVFGQLFFIYLFIRLSTQKMATLQTLVKEKYAGVQVNVKEVLNLENRIVALMEKEQFYLAEDCSLKAMAQVLKETPNCVSMVINSRFNQSYSDFINSYRIKLAIERLTSENNKLSMEGLAFECGFGNRSSFYQAFKKETGTTPSAYIKR